MAESIFYTPDVAGHHAMRVLPSLIAGMLERFGLPLELAFRLLSVTGYMAFGMITFWFLRRVNLKPILALSFTLLCLAAHPIIIMPLKLVYQSCDMWTYPLIVFMVYCSMLQRTKTLLLLSLVGILVRQNLFILGECSLLYCYVQSKQTRQLLYAGTLAVCYGMLQSYYHATSTFSALLQPPEGYFTPSHLWFVLTDSKILELFIPLLPLLVLLAKPMIQALWRYWHMTLYIAITAGQPLLAYHMTGNNLTRLSLQGIICLYLIAGWVSAKYQWTQKQEWLLLAYAGAMYITWGIPNRFMMMVAFAVILAVMMFKERRSLSLHVLENH
ncbi:MAG: hypothetical protein AB7I18_06870 [Candidatus Berkiella sp.]